MADGGAGSAAFDGWVQAAAPGLLRVAQLLLGDRTSAEKALTAALARSWRGWSSHTDEQRTDHQRTDEQRTDHQRTDEQRTDEQHTDERRIGAEDTALRHLVAAATRARPAAEPAARPGELPEGLGSSDRADVLARGALRRELAAMPAELRAVVVLRHAEQLPVERVARVLGEAVEQVERADEAALVLLGRDDALLPYLSPGAA